MMPEREFLEGQTTEVLERLSNLKALIEELTLDLGPVIMADVLERVASNMRQERFL